SRIALARSTGVACSSSTASITFDLPDPLGPISTLRGCSSNGSVPGAKERKPSSRRRRIKGGRITTPSERQFHPWRQLQSAGDFLHLLLCHRIDPALGIAVGGDD